MSISHVAGRSLDDQAVHCGGGPEHGAAAARQQHGRGGRQELHLRQDDAQQPPEVELDQPPEVEQQSQESDHDLLQSRPNCGPDYLPKFSPTVLLDTTTKYFCTLFLFFAPVRKSIFK